MDKTIFNFVGVRGGGMQGFFFLLYMPKMDNVWVVYVSLQKDNNGKDGWNSIAKLVFSCTFLMGLFMVGVSKKNSKTFVRLLFANNIYLK